MANLKDVIYLSNEDYQTLVSTGTVTIGTNPPLIYDEDNLYLTPETQNVKSVNNILPDDNGNVSVAIGGGTVTSVGAGTGLSISGTATVNPTVNIASGYKLPTTTEWNAIPQGTVTSVNGISPVSGNVSTTYIVQQSDIDAASCVIDPDTGEIITYVFTAAFSTLVESMKYTLVVNLGLFNPDFTGNVYLKPDIGGFEITGLGIFYNYTNTPISIFEPTIQCPFTFYKASASDTQLSLSANVAGNAISGISTVMSVSYDSVSNTFTSSTGDYTSTIFYADTLNGTPILNDNNSEALEQYLIARESSLPTASSTSPDLVEVNNIFYYKNIRQVHLVIHMFKLQNNM